MTCTLHHFFILCVHYVSLPFFVSTFVDLLILSVLLLVISLLTAYFSTLCLLIIVNIYLILHLIIFCFDWNFSSNSCFTWNSALLKLCVPCFMFSKLLLFWIIHFHTHAFKLSRTIPLTEFLQTCFLLKLTPRGLTP